MKPNKYFFLVLLALNVLVQVFYWGYFREQVQILYHAQQAEGFWAEVVAILYPRFFVEKHRFDLPFFLLKTEQILWRLLILSIFLGIFWRFSSKHFFESSFWKVSLARSRVVFLQIVLTCGWVYESFTWYKSLVRLSHLKELYQPYWLLRFVPFPNEEDLFYWFSACYIALLLSFIPQISAYFWALAVALLICLQGFLYGFGKIDHTYTTWLYVSMLLPFLLQNKAQVEAWALRLMQCVVAMVYFQAGLEKLLISGIDWLSPETLRSHLLAHPTPLGLQVAESTVLCSLGGVFLMSFQLGFICILFFPSLKYVFLLAGVCFHIATFVLLGIGGIVSFWYLVYIIWLLGEKPEAGVS